MGEAAPDGSDNVLHQHTGSRVITGFTWYQESTASGHQNVI